MKLDKVANSGNDEFYTPDYAIKPLLKYIPKTLRFGVRLTPQTAYSSNCYLNMDVK